MKVNFSSQPYLPPFERELARLYIVRMVPGINKVTAHWITEAAPPYTVKVFKGDNLVKTQTTSAHRITLTGLETETEYSILIEKDDLQSPMRHFRTAFYPGTLVNYLNPMDTQYRFSGQYLSSPSIVRFKEKLYVLMDIFGSNNGEPEGGHCLSLLYCSKDGKDWEYVTDLFPCFWGSLFLVGDKMCVIAVSAEVGDLLVSCTEDGLNWAQPTVLGRGHGNKARAGFHKNAVPFITYKNRIYGSIEYGGYGPKRFDSAIISCSVDSDILDVNSWTISGLTKVQDEWNGPKEILFAIEGNVVERNGEIFNILRFIEERALMLKYDPSALTKAPNFYKVINMPFAFTKFCIQKHESGVYYALGNIKPYTRTVLNLYRSIDLETWEVVKTIYDYGECDWEKVSVSYPSFILEGNTIHAVIRSGLNGAYNFHDTNCIIYFETTISNE